MQMKQAPIQSGERWKNLQPMRELVAESGETGVFGSFSLWLHFVTPCQHLVLLQSNIFSFKFCWFLLSHLVFVPPGLCLTWILFLLDYVVPPGLCFNWILSPLDFKCLEPTDFVSPGLCLSWTLDHPRLGLTWNLVWSSIGPSVETASRGLTLGKPRL